MKKDFNKLTRGWEAGRWNEYVNEFVQEGTTEDLYATRVLVEVLFLSQIIRGFNRTTLWFLGFDIDGPEVLEGIGKAEKDHWEGGMG